MLNNILNISNYILVGYYILNIIPLFRKKYFLKIYIKVNELLLFSIAFLLIYWSVDYYSFEKYVSNLFLGIILTLLYIPLMVFLTSPSIRYFLNFKYQLFEWISNIFIFPQKHFKQLILALWEELIWRVAFVLLLQQLGVGDSLIFLCGSVLFYLIHFSFSKKIIILTEFELFLFSCLLYGLYLLTYSLLLVWLIHFLRNSYLQYTRESYSSA